RHRGSRVADDVAARLEGDRARLRAAAGGEGSVQEDDVAVAFGSADRQVVLEGGIGPHGDEAGTVLVADDDLGEAVLDHVEAGGGQGQDARAASDADGGVRRARRDDEAAFGGGGGDGVHF